MPQKHSCPCQSQAVYLHLLCDLPGADHNIDAVVTWAAAGTGASQFSSEGWGVEVEGGKNRLELKEEALAAQCCHLPEHSGNALSARGWPGGPGP